MAYESLRAALDAKIYTNGNEEVTASMVNSVISDCISQLGNFECGGEITPTTLFDFNAELKWWFIAVKSGTYTNFDGIIIDDEVAIILYEDATFTKIELINKPSDVTDLSIHSVTELSDVTSVGSGNIITTVERTKLGTIEEGAEVNQSDSDIKTQYENNANTNAFTDSEKTKLGTISTGAEANVNADWNSTTGDSEILNKPTDVTDLSTHASSELSDGSNLVKGPATSTDNAITRFDGTTGKLVQNSPATLDDDGNIAGLKDTSTETVTIDSAVQMSYDPVTETLEFNFI